MRTAADATLLDVLAVCLGADLSLPEALVRIESSGALASQWVARIRPFARPGAPLARTLGAARVIDASEEAVLAHAQTAAAVERSLRAIVSRRKRLDLLRAAFLGGLAGPLAVAALTVVLNPLPNLIGSGPYVWPVLRGLFALGVVTVLVMVGVPAALGSPSLGPRVLGILARTPGAAWIARRHAEAELVTMLVPFTDGAEVEREGLVAAATTLSWSPLGEVARAVAMEGSTAPPLAKLAPHLTEATNLAIVSGTASKHLAAGLAARGDAIASELRTNLRRALRVTAYTLVVILSYDGVANLVSRGLPGMPLLPGATPSGEQKELDDLLKELDPPGHTN